MNKKKISGSKALKNANYINKVFFYTDFAYVATQSAIYKLSFDNFAQELAHEFA